MTAHSTRLTVTGHWSDPNPHRDRPSGALERAEEVVFRRPGTVELRPGFQDLGLGSEVLAIQDPDGVFAFAGTEDGDLFWQEHDGVLKSYLENVEYDASCPPNAVRGVDAGRTFYFCGVDGVRKLYPHLDGRTVQVGVPTPHLRVDGVAASGSAGTVQPLSYVAYRGILQIVYEDERTVTSGFSARTVIYNGDASNTVSPLVYMYLPHGLDVVAPTTRVLASVYRSKNATAYPPDELFLAYPDVEVTSAHI
jgi:hypothetical protein